MRQKYPFTIDAFVLLPDHFHCLWTLPEGDSDLSTRLRLIKTFVTKNYGSQLGINADISTSRQKRQERNLWQRRFWEHLIRDDSTIARIVGWVEARNPTFLYLLIITKDKRKPGHCWVTLSSTQPTLPYSLPTSGGIEFCHPHPNPWDNTHRVLRAAQERLQDLSQLLGDEDD